MRGLSRRLVSAQEDERRRLARELHDEVGQMLTALRMEVGRLERLRSADGATFAASAADCKRIVERVMESVRGLSMGLRPSMLDDLGLGAALDWQARDFSRRYELPVFLEVQGDVDGLPEPHRTCVYRVFQEALTNCAKHAQARRIEVSVRAAGGRLRLCVTDDGVGWDPRPGASGMGLVGIEERVREIQGTVAVDSRPGQGTTVSVEIPSPRQGEERHESAAR
jgi:signal transduction histidine kinase